MSARLAHTVDESRRLALEDVSSGRPTRSIGAFQRLGCLVAVVFLGLSLATGPSSAEQSIEDPYQAAYRRAYAELTPERRVDVAEGRLAWNGTDFVVSSPLFFKNYVRGLESEQEGDSTPPVAQPEPVLCPPSWPVWRNGLGEESHGLARAGAADGSGDFLFLGAQSGTPEFPASRVSAVFVVPPSSGMRGFDTEPGQTFFVALTGYGALDAPQALEVGLAFENGVWTLFTTADRVGEDEVGSRAGPVYRLAQTDRPDGAGLEDDARPFEVRMVLEVVQDGSYRVTATPLAGAVWQVSETVTSTEAGLLSSTPLVGEEGLPSPLELDLTDDSDWNGNDIPSRSHSGLVADGVGNRFGVRIQLVLDQDPRQPKVAGRSVSSVGVYDFRVNDARLDVDHGRGPYGAAQLACPAVPSAGRSAAAHPAYVWLGGKTLAKEPDAAYRVGVNIVSPSVAADPSGAGQSQPDGRGGDARTGQATAYSWGDPHIHTFDGYFYSFMAVGDYVLSVAIDPSDPFMVQGRFRPFEGNRRGQEGTAVWSIYEAFAMNVDGTVVEFYAAGDDAQPLVVVDGETLASGDYLLQLGGGGSVRLAGTTATATWADGTSLSTEMFTVVGGDERMAGSVRLNVPTSRWQTLHGLFGTNDGRMSNDLGLPNETVLNVAGLSDEEVSKELYVGPFRSQWRVRSPRSLFTRGTDPFDPFYPSDVIRLEELDPVLVAAAEDACRTYGVATAGVLSRCILDMAKTGSESFARASAAVDPAAPGITLSPSGVYLTASETVELTAVPHGVPGADRLSWAAEEGVIEGDGTSIRFTPPAAEGSYEVVAYVPGAPGVAAVAKVVVAGTLAVSPAEVWVYSGDAVTFAARGIEDRSVEWFVADGQLQASGRWAVYVAPSRGGDVMVQTSLLDAPLVHADATVHVYGNILYPQTPSVDPGAELNLVWVNAQNLEVEWEASGGAVEGYGHRATFRAPDEAGEYVVTAHSASDARVHAVAVVTVRSGCCAN